jgi:hypothetical protein
VSGDDRRDIINPVAGPHPRLTPQRLDELRADPLWLKVHEAALVVLARADVSDSEDGQLGAGVACEIADEIALGVVAGGAP